MVTQPPGFTRRVRELADRAGTLLVLDEVAVGFGRSGRLFACEKEGVAPDFLCLAQGTDRRLPADGRDAHDRADLRGVPGPPSEGRTFFHGHTYTGNPLAARRPRMRRSTSSSRPTCSQQLPGKDRRDSRAAGRPAGAAVGGRHPAVRSRRGDRAGRRPGDANALSGGRAARDEGVSARRGIAACSFARWAT